MIYVIGPSHIHKDFTNIIQPELESGKLFPNCILDGYPGIPNWSQHLHASIKQHIDANDSVVWMVSDYKFNNEDYYTLVNAPPGTVALDTVGKPNNVIKDFCTPEHITCFAEHSLAHIDSIVRKYPAIKLIFWCLYKRTKANKNSSYPHNYWYDAIKTRYPDNIIDIDKYISPELFNKVIRDQGAHPTQKGYVLLHIMIMSSFRLIKQPPPPSFSIKTPQVSQPTPLHYSPSSQTSPAMLPAPSPRQRPAHPPQSVPLQSKSLHRIPLLPSSASRRGP